PWWWPWQRAVDRSRAAARTSPTQVLAPSKPQTTPPVSAKAPPPPTPTPAGTNALKRCMQLTQPWWTGMIGRRRGEDLNGKALGSTADYVASIGGRGVLDSRCLGCGAGRSQLTAGWTAQPGAARWHRPGRQLAVGACQRGRVVPS